MTILVFQESHVLSIYDTFFDGLKDYTQDKRGDIGAWVREASVSGLQVIILIYLVRSTIIRLWFQVLTLLLSEHYPKILSSDLLNKILSYTAQQAVEKIDRTRALAGKVFYSFIHR